MRQLTIPEIIKLGDISVPFSANYEANGNIFGERMAINAPQTIALVTDALRWQWEGFADSEVRATATITIDTIGNASDTIEVFVNDPFLGLISLGLYSLTNLDTTTDLIATNLTAVLALNIYGYGATSVNNVITILAAAGTGSLINGGNNLTCVITTSVRFLLTENSDILITENNSYIITE